MSVIKVITPLVCASAFLIGGCTSERFGSPYRHSNPPPAIRTAPLENVSQAPLGPPEGYPPPPGEGRQMQGELGTIRGGIELTPNLVAGVWRAEIDDLPCQIATPMTKSGQGYRAGPMRCPVALASIHSWNIDGTQLMFYDREGQIVAQLSSSNGTRFSGRTLSGSSLVLTR